MFHLPMVSRESLVRAEMIDPEADILYVEWPRRDLSDATGPGSRGAIPPKIIYR